MPDSGSGPDVPAWAAPEAGQAPPTTGAPEVDGGVIDEPPARVGAPRLPVPLRPMTTSDLLDGGFAILKNRPAAVFGACALVIVPLRVAEAFLQRNALSNSTLNVLFNDTSTSSSPRSSTASGGDVLAVYAGLILGTLAVYFAGAVIARMVSAWYAGGELSAGETLKAVFQASPVIVAVWFVLLIPNAAGYAAGCIGWFFVNPLFIVAVPVVMIEGLGPIKAISRSVQLVGRRYLWVVLYGLVITIMAYFARNALTLVPQFLGVTLPSPWNWIALSAGQTIVELIITPAVAGVAVLLYLDLRIRTEGLDIELKAADAFASVP